MERAINKERINKEKIKITLTLTLTLSPTERSPGISKKGPAGSLVQKKGQMFHFAILVGFLVGRTVRRHEGQASKQPMVPQLSYCYYWSR
jgi:hypothetical protein